MPRQRSRTCDQSPRDLTLKTGGGGGGAESAPLDVSRDNFAEFFFRAASFHDFFSLKSCATFGAIFGKIGRTVLKLRNII